MDIDKDIDIRCLIADLAQCEYRVARKECFDYKGSTKCPHRDKLKREFEQYLADKERAKYKLEFPD